ncbi:FecR family protein [Gelidibacter maritimus]|uniref:FecR family protein n=1 Tax=Gelidibacter maritimus TaxID=2761487 RepID=A0A7W2R5D6_9FLAO|nr:FecR family protein [Gelidibacter maritimus]MBA6154663.1 FecR family protein [Gelidibacter maritimus]
MTSESRLKKALEAIAATGKLNPESLTHLTEVERKLVETIFQQNSVIESLRFIEGLDTDKEWKLLNEQLNKTETLGSEARIKPIWKSIMRYAALFVGLFAVGYAVFNKDNIEVDHQVSHMDGVQLLIENGEAMILEQVAKEDIVVSGKTIAHQDGSSINYDANSDENQIVFHQIIIPHGKMFNVKLSDGTVVHLNSGSRMKYPTSFLEGRAREVFIEGQAYFDVSPDKQRPFIVNADDVSIEVLGTEFVVSTYSEDPEINTVLVEGSITMANSFLPKDVITLTPGTKGSWNKDNHKTSLENVNVQDYIGWMSGELVFRNSPFSNMQKKLERKYNVEIVNNNSALSKKVFNASFSKDIESIEDVLKYISEIYPFQYEISDRHVLIF